MSWDDALEKYRESWKTSEDAAWKREPDPAAWMRSGMKKTETDLKDRHGRGEDQVLDYIEFAERSNLQLWRLPDGTPASEVEFNEDFNGIQVKGFIDLIMEDPLTGNLLVRDIKTGAKKPVGWMQLATYRIAMRKKYSVEIDWGDYWMSKDKAPTATAYLGGIPDAQVVAQFQMMDHAEKSGIYLANLGDHCTRCDVAKYCPYVGGEAPDGIPALGT